MNRYWYGLMGLVLLAGMIGGGTWYVCHISGEMEQLVSRAQEELSINHPQEATKLLQESTKFWEHHLNALETVVDHSAVEQVSVPLAEATAFLQYGKTAHAAAACQNVLKMLRALRDGQQVGLYNLF